MRFPSWCLASLVVVAGGACQRNASAQAAQDDTAPVGCFELSDRAGLASSMSILLCTAATSVAPGQCFVEGTRHHGEISTDDLVQLCHGATSLDPLRCYAQLDAEGTLTSHQIVSYCASSCPLGPPPPQASSAACFTRGLNETQLSQQLVAQLCLGSHSAAPVACYAEGNSHTQLATSDLVELCTPHYSCQYVNQTPY